MTDLDLSADPDFDSRDRSFMKNLQQMHGLDLKTAHSLTNASKLRDTTTDTPEYYDINNFDATDMEFMNHLIKSTEIHVSDAIKLIKRQKVENEATIKKDCQAYREQLIAQMACQDVAGQVDEKSCSKLADEAIAVISSGENGERAAIMRQNMVYQNNVIPRVERQVISNRVPQSLIESLKQAKSDIKNNEEKNKNVFRKQSPTYQETLTAQKERQNLEERVAQRSRGEPYENTKIPGPRDKTHAFHILAEVITNMFPEEPHFHDDLFPEANLVTGPRPGTIKLENEFWRLQLFQVTTPTFKGKEYLVKYWTGKCHPSGPGFAQLKQFHHFKDLCQFLLAVTVEINGKDNEYQIEVSLPPKIMALESVCQMKPNWADVRNALKDRIRLTNENMRMRQEIRRGQHRIQQIGNETKVTLGQGFSNQSQDRASPSVAPKNNEMTQHRGPLTFVQTRAPAPIAMMTTPVASNNQVISDSFVAFDPVASEVSVFNNVPPRSPMFSNAVANADNANKKVASDLLSTAPSTTKTNTSMSAPDKGSQSGQTQFPKYHPHHQDLKKINILAMFPESTNAVDVAQSSNCSGQLSTGYPPLRASNLHNHELIDPSLQNLETIAGLPNNSFDSAVGLGMKDTTLEGVIQASIDGSKHSGEAQATKESSKTDNGGDNAQAVSKRKFDVEDEQDVGKNTEIDGSAPKHDTVEQKSKRIKLKNVQHNNDLQRPKMIPTMTASLTSGNNNEQPVSKIASRTNHHISANERDRRIAQLLRKTQTDKSFADRMSTLAKSSATFVTPTAGLTPKSKAQMMKELIAMSENNPTFRTANSTFRKIYNPEPADAYAPQLLTPPPSTEKKKVDTASMIESLMRNPAKLREFAAYAIARRAGGEIAPPIPLSITSSTSLDAVSSQTPTHKRAPSMVFDTQNENNDQ